MGDMSLDELRAREAQLLGELAGVRRLIREAAAPVKRDPRLERIKEAKIALERAERVYKRMRDAAVFTPGEGIPVPLSKLEEVEYHVLEARKRVREAEETA